MGTFPNSKTPKPIAPFDQINGASTLSTLGNERNDSMPLLFWDSLAVESLVHVTVDRQLKGNIN